MDGHVHGLSTAKILAVFHYYYKILLVGYGVAQYGDVLSSYQGCQPVTDGYFSNIEYRVVNSIKTCCF